MGLSSLSTSDNFREDFEGWETEKEEMLLTGQWLFKSQLII